jgi:hypothetical protein
MVAWVTRSPFATPITYTLYDNDYRVEYIQRAGGQARTAPRNDAINQGNTVANLTAFKELLRGVDVLVDEESYPDSRLATAATFMANYGFTVEDAASGLYPFLTYDMVLRVDKGMSDGTYGATYFGIDWFEGSLVNPNRVVEDLAYYLFPAVFPQLNQTVFMRNLLKGELPVVSSAADCDAMCEDAAMLAPLSNACVSATAMLPPPPPRAPSPSPVAASSPVAVAVAHAALLATVRLMEPLGASLRLSPCSRFRGYSRAPWGFCVVLHYSKRSVRVQRTLVLCHCYTGDHLYTVTIALSVLFVVECQLDFRDN